MERRKGAESTHRVDAGGSEEIHELQRQSLKVIQHLVQLVLRKLVQRYGLRRFEVLLKHLQR